MFLSSLSLQEVRSSLKESQRTASELGEKLQEVQLARSSAEQVFFLLSESLLMEIEYFVR